MSAQQNSINKSHQICVPNISISSKVSKVFFFCGCFLIFSHSTWITSSFVAADKHTHGSIDSKVFSNGLKGFSLLLFLPSIYLHSIKSIFIFRFSLLLCLSLSLSISISYDDTEEEVILNRHIFARNTSEPTNYTVIYKYVRNKLAGSISYIEFDVVNCVSIKLAICNGKWKME